MTKPKIYVYLWFDVEDYVTPESNEIPLRAVRILKKYKIPVTVKLVAEKVRFMKDLRRNDVISLLKEYCDIGYHTDTHSRHPVVYEYIRKMNTMEGAREIEWRERLGMEEVTSTIGKTLSCFGHAGTQWCPHYYPYLKGARIGVYMDATDVVNIDDSPYWYCGVLNLNNTGKNYIRFDGTFERPGGIIKLKRRFAGICNRLERRGKGGAISILWHPHTAINRVYWDAVNFADGKNKPRGEYSLPKKYPEEIRERAIRDFEELVRFGSSFGDVRFISATEASEIYRRKLETTLGVAQVERISRALCRSKGKIGFFKLGEEYLSPAQTFCALVNFVASFSKTRRTPKRIAISEPLGPVSCFRSMTKDKNFTLVDILSSSEKVSNILAIKGCIPSSIKIGRVGRLRPSDYLATLAPLVVQLASGRADPDPKVKLRRASMILGQRYVDAEAFKRACEWSILPRGFKAPKILEQARLQAWTLVPAVAKK